MSVFTTLRARWNAYWFRPAPLLDLAVCRVIVVGVHLFVMLVPYALLKYPVYGMLEHYAALPASKWNPEPLLMRLFLLPLGGARPGLELTQWVQALTIVAGALALVWVIGFYAVVEGILYVALAFRLKKHVHA